jgi:PAS domain S-box-containing protein
MDANGVVTFVNPAARATLGYDTTELLGRHGHDVLHGTRADGSTYPWQECPVRESLSRGTTVQTSEEYIAADGTRLPIELTASPVVENGQITGAVVVFRDVTKRREVDRMKDEFISVVSHELRTPLTSIRGSLGLVSSGSLGELPPRAGRMVSVAAESTDRLTRLINDILDIERIKSVELPMERAVSDIADLVDAALRELQPMTTAAGVRVVSHVETAQVDCDADRIVQTIMNLVSNAVKFSARGDAVVVRAAVEGKDVVVSVADQGRGVPADKMTASSVVSSRSTRRTRGRRAAPVSASRSARASSSGTVDASGRRAPWASGRCSGSPSGGGTAPGAQRRRRRAGRARLRRRPRPPRRGHRPARGRRAARDRQRRRQRGVPARGPRAPGGRPARPQHAGT